MSERVRKWQRRLEEHFADASDIVGGGLTPVLQAEKLYVHRVLEHYHGYLMLIDSFLSFFKGTLESAELSARANSNIVSGTYYMSFVFDMLAMFKKCRACERVFIAGYPLSAFALLRDLKDQAMLLAAVINGDADYRAVRGFDVLNGVSGPTYGHYEGVIRRRRDAERSARTHIIGEASGLDASTRQCLKRWNQMFNDEVHGALYTVASDMSGYVQGTKQFSLLPVFDEERDGFYVNRSSEIGWILHRIITYLQLRQSMFGAEWAEKWTVLDESFRQIIVAVKDKGAEVAGAVVELVEKKLAFSPKDTWYHERAGEENSK